MRRQSVAGASRVMNTSQRFKFSFIFCIFLSLLTACGDNGYLLQSFKGHMDLMSKARPIEDILAENEAPNELCDQLEKVVVLREFAVKSLQLPDHGSYLDYADLGRPYAVWNVVAAPELSLEMLQWCFPIIGCVTYRGYFDEMSAIAVKDAFVRQGFDADVYGVEAYSTLSWFDDPVLNTFLKNDEIHLASLLFHELAHQVVYVPDDTTFNESFAKTVEIEGLRRWAHHAQSPTLMEEYERREHLSSQFRGFLFDIRQELHTVYSSPLDNTEKRKAKQEIVNRAYDEYAELKKSWGSYSGFDQWMDKGINNARLASIASYYDLVPAFQTLLKNVGHDLSAFYIEVKKLASQPEKIRAAHLQSLVPFQKVSFKNP